MFIFITAHANCTSYLQHVYFFCHLDAIPGYSVLTHESNEAEVLTEISFLVAHNYM